MLVAAEHLGSVGVGVTKSQFFRANDGKVYIVKLKNNIFGPKVLVSEFLAAAFGRIMNLCFPPSGVIALDEQTLRQSRRLIGSGASPGQHFASEYLAGAEYVRPDNLGKAVNITEMAGVMLFDHMFHNPDRAQNKKNLLLRQEDAGFRIYAIDNSHLFKSGRWTRAALDALSAKLRIYYHYSFGLLLRDRLSPPDFLPYLDKVAKLGNEQIDSLVRAVPEKWLPADAPEREALARFIKIRRDMAEDIWDKLCKHIPKARGGHRRLPGRVIRLAGKAKLQDGAAAGRAVGACRKIGGRG